MRSRSNSGAMLDVYHHQLTKLMLEVQHPLTGLVSYRDPNSSYYNHAWIRDNVYCCMAAWGLSLAYKKCTTDRDSESRVNYLEKSVIKLMRGLMTCMMLQSDKIEAFKKSQGKYDSIHAKFDASNFKAVVGDYEWGHLQMDAIAIYVLLLAQMTVSGLSIIMNHDEVAFVQNLVFYLENAYKTPDFGIWERGDKTNRGHVELNASSVGMAKAALEAIQSVDLFGARGSSQSVITCMPDEITQCNVVLQSLLPRESNSKETDMALLTVITYPAFAVDDTWMIETVRNSVCDKLEGYYGCKRFLRDGYKTVAEDPNRLYYESHELKLFENIECEWPIGFCFLLFDALFRTDKEAVDKYRKKLDSLMIPCPDLGFHVLPELYYVPYDKINLEKNKPNTQDRIPGGKVPHLWGHCLWIITSLLCDGLLTIGEIDPLNRRLSSEERLDVIVQIAPVAENDDVKFALEMEGINVETSEELANSDMKLRIFHSHVLSQLFTKLGECPKLGLTGRYPHDFVGYEGTSRFYVVKENLIAFVPYYLNKMKFYLALDHSLILTLLKIMVQFFKLNWRSLGRPTVILLVTKEFLDPETGKITELYLKTLQKLRSGLLDGLRVSFGNVSSFYATSSIRRLGFLERLIDDESINPLEHHASITGRTDSASIILRSSMFKPSLELSRRISIFRTAMATREFGVAPPSPPKASGPSSSMPKVSTITSFLASYVEDPANRSRKRSEIDSANEVELIMLLRSTSSLTEQLDVLVFMHNKFGLDYTVQIGDQKPTIRLLLKELYRKSSEVLAWSVLRYTASLLHKTQDNITSSVLQILVRRKALTIGMPPEPRERTIVKPITLENFKDMLNAACGTSSPLAALTQEVINIIALLIATQPHLFDGMMRIRTGLIIQVLTQEIARSLNTHLDDGMEHLLKMEPYSIYELVCNLFSGREIKLTYSSRKPSEGQSELTLVKFSRKDMSRIMMSINQDLESDDDGASSESEEGEGSGYARGTWLRRRRIDGSLTRVPTGFYQAVWRLLDRCQEGIYVEQNMLFAGWTQEMTQDELKFDLKVEEVFSKIAEPEYRQVLIEAMMVLASIVDHQAGYRLDSVIHIENLAKHANHLSLQEMQRIHPDVPYDTLCKGIKDLSFYFYDSAPSGRYGTLTYLIKATVMCLEALCPTSPDKSACKVN